VRDPLGVGVTECDANSERVPHRDGQRFSLCLDKCQCLSLGDREWDSELCFANRMW